MIDSGSLGLDRFTNIKEFQCNYLEVSIDFGKFLKRNQDTMTHLTLEVGGGHEELESPESYGPLQQ